MRIGFVLVRIRLADKSVRPTQAHCDADVVFGEAGLGELKFEFGEHVGGGADGVGVLADTARHLDEDAVDLGLFFVEEADEVVVLLDGFDWLDVDRLAAGTRAVHYPRNATLLFDLDGDDEALAADGDELVLDDFAFGKTAEVAAEGFLDGPALLFDVATDAGEFGRGAVFESAIGLN